MACTLRLEADDGIYPVLNRGNCWADIFRADKTKAAFLQCLGEVCGKTGWRVHGWCLLSNHSHLAVETPPGNLVGGIPWLQGTFSARFNRRRGERGHLAREWPNAGEATDDKWEKYFRVSLMGSPWFTEGVVPFMVRPKGGAIVNVGPGQSLVGRRNPAAYTTIKTALQDGSGRLDAERGLRLRPAHHSRQGDLGGRNQDENFPGAGLGAASVPAQQDVPRSDRPAAGSRAGRSLPCLRRIFLRDGRRPAGRWRLDRDGMHASTWKAGVASAVITPSESMGLAGWAVRKPAATGKAVDLFAKALALADPAGERVILVTADLMAILRAVAAAVAVHLGQRCNLSRAWLLFNASHTHTGPEVRPEKIPFFEIPAEFAARMAPDVLRLEESLTSVIVAALGELEPAALLVHQARAGLAANRGAPTRVVDHDVPVLAINRADGTRLAILFGYACHNLTLPPTFCEYHGDYAGVAQAMLEKKFPGAPALFIAGTGGDQEPFPGGTPELTRRHGETLAAEVEQGISRGGRAVSGLLPIGFEEVMLDLQPLPSAEVLQAELTSSDRARSRKAGYLSAALAERTPLANRRACPVHGRHFGCDRLLIAPGGEPVVDYARRFKADFGGPLVWGAGYANDLLGCLATRQLQQAGGDEGGRATLWSARPTPLAETGEARVVEAVHRLVGRGRASALRPPH